eukprot:1158485-Pelagomonas_calceolata.AAC.8
MVLCDLGRQATSRQSLPMTANLAAEGSSFMATPNALDAASVQNRCCKDSIEMTASTSAQCANAVWRVSKDVLEAAHVAALCTTRLQVYQALVGLGVALHEICQTHVKVAIQPSIFCPALTREPRLHPMSCVRTQLTEFFAQYAPVNCVRMRRHIVSKSFKGSLFVEFASVADAEKGCCYPVDGGSWIHLVTTSCQRPKQYARGSPQPFKHCLNAF